MHIEAIIDVTDPVIRLPVQISASSIGIVKLAIPKTFDNKTTFIKVCADVVIPQLDGLRCLGTFVAHCKDRCAHIVIEPRQTIFHSLATTTFQEIKFQFLDQSGEQIEFSKGQCLVTLQLGDIESRNHRN